MAKKIKLLSGEVELSNGVKVNIGIEFDNPKDMSRELILAVYNHYHNQGGKSSTDARLETALALGYSESNVRYHTT